jgi:protein phosphatase 1D
MSNDRPESDSCRNVVVNMRVTANSMQGQRKYMEDCYKIRFQRETGSSNTNIKDDCQNSANSNNNGQSSDILFSYFGIFDGHGGKEAAQFAKEKLYWRIVELDDFWSDDDEKVLAAIRMGFVQCHMDMWKEQSKFINFIINKIR